MEQAQAFVGSVSNANIVWSGVYIKIKKNNKFIGQPNRLDKMLKQQKNE